MKKIGFIICALMLTSLFGCNTSTKSNTNQGTAQSTTPIPTKTSMVAPTSTPTATSNNGMNTTTTKYKDGTYTAFSDKWQYGQESAVVKIKGGKIIYITLKRLDTKGKEVNYKEWVGQKEANGSIKPNLNKFRIDMAKRMLAKQTYMVDTIASATVSTGGWKLAVQRALDKAK